MDHSESHREKVQPGFFSAALYRKSRLLDRFSDVLQKNPKIASWGYVSSGFFASGETSSQGITF